MKCPKNNHLMEVDNFLEEIKSMLEIDCYHENIVNLQGITYKKKSNESSIEVSFLGKSCRITHVPHYKDIY